MPSTINNITLFDSNQYRWKDMSFSIFGVKIIPIQELTYEVEMEDEELYGAGDEPFDISSGNKKYSGQMILLRSVFDSIMTAAVAAGYRDILDVRFPITVVYSNDTRTTTDILVNCKISKYNLGGKQNDKSLPVTLPLKFTSLKRS